LVEWLFGSPAALISNPEELRSKGYPGDIVNPSPVKTGMDLQFEIPPLPEGGGLLSEIKMKVTNEKECYCHTCDRAFHFLGIAKHRAMHRKKQENCTITFTHGDTYTWKYSEKNKRGSK
jgi:hypothetical protein